MDGVVGADSVVGCYSSFGFANKTLRIANRKKIGRVSSDDGVVARVLE